ncbi:MAG: phosphoribosylglycinamide formyltransferase [Bacteroidota bacterium]
MLTRLLHLAVLGSGRGSNFGAILEAMHGGTLPGVRVSLVMSNNSGAGILETARTHGIPALHLSRASCGGEQELWDRTLRELASREIDLVILAGYMKKLPPRLVEAYRGRILNIHPALLPRFGGEGMYGIRVHEAVLASGEKFSGATVHVVDESYDHGPVLLQRTVPVLPQDTPETLASRVLEAEHLLYPEAIRMAAQRLAAGCEAASGPT